MQFIAVVIAKAYRKVLKPYITPTNMPVAETILEQALASSSNLLFAFAFIAGEIVTMIG